MRNLALAVVLLSGLSARADILFVNFNNNIQEHIAAAEAARERKERVIFFPELSDQAVTKLKSLQNEIDSYEARSREAKGKKKDEFKAKVEELRKQRDSLSPKIDSKNFKAKFNEMLAKEKNAKISTIVLSGHDGSGRFHGINGSISATNFREAFAENPSHFADTKAMVLAGCYTGTLGTLTAEWQNLTPNLELVSGYEVKAPLGHVDTGLVFLKDILSKEDVFLKAQSAEKLQDAFNNLKYARQLDTTICTDDFFVTKNGAARISDLLGACERIVKDGELDEMLKQYNCFLEAMTDECASPPTDTSKGIVRKYYNEAQKYSFCSSVLAENGQEYPDTEVFMRMIFHQQVMRNYVNLYGDDLNKAGADLKAAGIEFDASVFSDEGPKQRQRILNEIRNVYAQVDEKKKDGDFLLSPEGLRMVKGYWVVTDAEVVMSMSPDVVPPTWIDPGASDPTVFNSRDVPAEQYRKIRVNYYQEFVRSQYFQDKKKLGVELNLPQDKNGFPIWPKDPVPELLRLQKETVDRELARVEKMADPKDKEALKAAVLAGAK